MLTASSTSLIDRLRATKRLPSPPGTAVRVLELCRNEGSSVQQIAETIMSDPALSGRLLRYANSSIVGAGHQVASIREAVLLLGLRSVKLTSLGFSIANPDFQPRCPHFDLQQFWADSFATATLARRIAAELASVDREEAFTAGLLAGIGRLAFAYGCPEKYSRVLQAVRAGQSLMEAERECFGLDHVQFGAQLLENWGLPDILVQAVAQQMLPLEATQAGPAVHALARVVSLATRLAPLFTRTDTPSAELHSAARRLVEMELKLDPQAWQRIADEILSDYRQVAELFDVGIDGPAAVFDLYAEAQEEVTRVGMVAHCERTRVLAENKDLLRRATTDALTGIANRAKFDERLREITAAHQRGHGDFALLLADIDHFKKFNDTYGHDVGDLVLKEVARTMRGAVRDVDLLARYGGEEFAILAPQTDSRGAGSIAARVRECVDTLRIPHDGQDLHVTISIGVALSSDSCESPGAEQIVADADKQLYLAKQAGRNNWFYLGRSAAELTCVTGSA
jgi:two-component system cell cycle response regulator